jgi:hypothetical protein
LGLISGERFPIEAFGLGQIARLVRVHSALNKLIGVELHFDFAYDGGGLGRGGKATLSVNGKPVAEGRVERTQPNIFSADETADVGIDNQTPVAEGIGIGADTRFTGKINKITLEVGPVK